jgi:hypothetical protein
MSVNEMAGSSGQSAGNAEVRPATETAGATGLSYDKTEIWVPRTHCPLERYLACAIYRFSDGVVYVGLWNEWGNLSALLRLP